MTPEHDEYEAAQDVEKDVAFALAWLTAWSIAPDDIETETEPTEPIVVETDNPA